MAELQASMSQSEFERWAQFYELAPFDDLHRIYRPTALLAQRLAGGEINEMLDWLRPSPERLKMKEGFSDVDMSVFQAFGIKG